MSVRATDNTVLRATQGSLPSSTKDDWEWEMVPDHAAGTGNPEDFDKFEGTPLVDSHGIPLSQRVSIVNEESPSLLQNLANTVNMSGFYILLILIPILLIPLAILL